MKSERRIQRNRIRRQRELRKNILLSTLMICFAVSLFFSVGSFLSNAKAQDTEISYKYYASIPIEKGDTLWSIAQEHMGNHYDSVEAYIEELCRINSLDADESILVGEYLIVPYYSTEFVQ